MDSANYNHMVKRVIRKGITVFAPQLLLWSADIYGNAGYDRAKTDQRLKQFGGSITALEVFCIMRSTDYFAGLDNIDENRIGMIGLSYGGMYTLYTAAADVRIKAALSSCWFGERLDNLWTDWKYFNQLNIFSDEEVGSLVFPRKLYVEIGKYDETFSPEKAEPYLRRLEEYAQKENCSDSLKTKIFEGAHELDKANDGIKFFIENLITKNP
jgi:dienelactone hydrolase